MSTATFAADDAASALSGRFIDIGGTLLMNTLQEGSRFDTVAFCKKLRVKVAWTFGGTPLAVYVDGVAIARPALPLTADYVTIIDEASDASRTVSLRFDPASGSNLNCIIPDFWELTADGNPTLTYPSFGSVNAVNASCFAFESITRDGGGNNQDAAFLRYSNESIRFKATVTGLNIFFRGNSTDPTDYGWSLTIDGIRQTPSIFFTQPAGLWDIYDLGLALDGAHEHEYEIQLAYGHNVQLATIYAVGGTINQSPLALRSLRYLWIGDSLTAAQADGSGIRLDAGEGHPAFVQDALGGSVFNDGISGSSVGDVDYTGYQPDRSITAACVMWGRNNITFSGGNPDPAQFKIDAKSFLNSFLSTTTVCPLYVFDIINRDDGGDAVTALLNSVWTDAVNEIADARLVRVTGGFNCVSAENYYPTDHIHFLPAGQTQVGQNRLLTLAPAPSGNALLGGGFWM